MESHSKHILYEGIPDIFEQTCSLIKMLDLLDYPSYFLFSVVLYYMNNEILKANKKIGITGQIQFWQKQGGCDLSERFPNLGLG